MTESESFIYSNRTETFCSNNSLWVENFNTSKQFMVISDIISNYYIRITYTVCRI